MQEQDSSKGAQLNEQSASELWVKFAPVLTRVESRISERFNSPNNQSSIHS